MAPCFARAISAGSRCHNRTFRWTRSRWTFVAISVSKDLSWSGLAVANAFPKACHSLIACICRAASCRLRPAKMASWRKCASSDCATPTNRLLRPRNRSCKCVSVCSRFPWVKPFLGSGMEEWTRMKELTHLPLFNPCSQAGAHAHREQVSGSRGEAEDDDEHLDVVVEVFFLDLFFDVEEDDRD